MEKVPPSVQEAAALSGVSVRQEEWRPIPGFLGYEVSNLGRMVSRRRRRPRLMRQTINTYGYPTVSLYRGTEKPIRRAVHLLVAAAFLGPRPEGMQVRHLDGDPQHNTPSNLAYGTPSENGLDQVRHGTHQHSRKTHCPEGHPYDEVNTGRTRDGGRRCNTCNRLRVADFKRRKQVAA